MFIACLVAGNLIFQKFFYWAPFTFLDFGAQQGTIWHSITHYEFNISVGIIPYPLTFLVTDIISEIYGRRRANMVVISGLVSTVVIFLIVLLADVAPATDFSPVSDTMFTKVFGLTGVAVTASMTAYLIAQFVDIRIFHFWKKLTRGKHLWLRNNFSTVFSQFIDTAVVLLLLCAFGAIEWALFLTLLLNGFLYKVLVALFDTPLFYLCAWYFRKKFGLREDEELMIV